jgi:hypothetical protein
VFGIDYDAVAKRLIVGPLLAPELRATRIAIEGVRLPTQEDARLSVSIVPRENGKTEFEISVNAVPKGVLLVVRFDGGSREMPLASEQRVVFERR